jgi:hypothetical protein
MKTKPKIIQLLALSAGALLPLCATTNAIASDITFAVIGPQEYNLPVNFKDPFNVFVQYGEFNSTNRAWSPSGGLYNTNVNTNLFVGLSKYVRFWTFDSIPNVGFAYEVIVPEVMITGGGSAVKGIGDPLTGPAVWIKPTKDTTLGLQSFVQLPIGETQVSNHYWANYSSIFFDWETPLMGFTGNAGAVFRSIQSAPGVAHIDEGTTLHANLRLSWKATKLWEPFVAFDWQTTGSSNFAYGGGVAALASQETALGAGVMAHFSDVASLTLRYSRGVEGYNTGLTNAGYLKFAYVW